jgi:hypothetical protein
MTLTAVQAEHRMIRNLSLRGLIYTMLLVLCATPLTVWIGLWALIPATLLILIIANDVANRAAGFYDTQPAPATNATVEER